MPYKKIFLLSMIGSFINAVEIINNTGTNLLICEITYNESQKDTSTFSLIANNPGQTFKRDDVLSVRIWFKINESIQSIDLSELENNIKIDLTLNNDKVFAEYIFIDETEFIEPVVTSNNFMNALNLNTDTDTTDNLESPEYSDEETILKEKKRKKGKRRLIVCCIVS